MTTFQALPNRAEQRWNHPAMMLWSTLTHALSFVTALSFHEAIQTSFSKAFEQGSIGDVTYKWLFAILVFMTTGVVIVFFSRAIQRLNQVRQRQMEHTRQPPAVRSQTADIQLQEVRNSRPLFGIDSEDEQDEAQFY